MVGEKPLISFSPDMIYQMLLGISHKEADMNKDEWDKTYTERNAKAEMTGPALAGLYIMIPVLAVLAFWNPKILITIPMLIIWIILKRKSNKK